MTKLFFALAILSTPAAFADVDGPNDVGYPEVRYLSWCVNNSVMEEGTRGQAVLKADCEASGLVCKQEERILGGGRVSYAFCQARR